VFAVRSGGNTAFNAIASREDALALLVVTLLPGDDLTMAIQGNVRCAANQPAARWCAMQ